MRSQVVDKVLPVMAVIQALWLLIGHRSILILPGLLLAVLAVEASRKKLEILQVQLPIAALITLNLVGIVATLQEIPPFRLLFAAVLTSYLAVLVAGAISRYRSVPLQRSMFIAAAVTLPLLAIEAGMQLAHVGTPVERQRSPTNAVGMGIPPSPAPNLTYAAGSSWTTLYPDNPRGYFQVPVDTSERWSLRINDETSVASLTRDPRSLDAIRVRVDSLGRSEAWVVQLRHRPLQVENGESYTLGFRARAGTRRIIAPVLAGSASDGQAVGFAGGRIQLDTAWQTYRWTFRATATDSARFFMDVGGIASWIEISNLSLVSSSGANALSARGSQLSVGFRFNQMGCRGPTVDSTRTTGVTRILALGDSYTLGAGVREGDAYPARLQALLNERTPRRPGSARFEVINCGVTGAGIADIRALFDSLAPRYAPDLVVVGLNPGDDKRRADDVGLTTTFTDDALGRVFITWSRARELIERSRAGAFDGSAFAEGLDAIQQAASARGARLVVLVFPHRSGPNVEALEQFVTGRLANTSAISLSVGSLLKPFRETELDVHPALDQHPNEVAHRMVADALERFLRQQQALPAVDSTPPATRATTRR